MLKPLAVALSASLVLLAPGVMAEEATPYDWSGAYIGLSLGGVALGANATTELPDVPDATYPLDPEVQPQLGVSAGYNVMLDDFLLLGIEGDITKTLPADTAY